MNDLRADGSLRGWADRLAESLADEVSDFRYANLAVRGNRVTHVVNDQLPRALSLSPDLASVAIGVNDMLRPRFDLQECVSGVEQTVSQLRQAGSEVVLVSFGDPRPRSRALGIIGERIGEYGTHLRRIATEQNAYLVDFWGAPVFDADLCWSDDRLHLSTLGHKVAASAALNALSRSDDSWRAGIPEARGAPGALTLRARDARWVGTHVAPWLLRKLRPRPAHSCRRPDLEPYP